MPPIRYRAPPNGPRAGNNSEPPLKILVLGDFKRATYTGKNIVTIRCGCDLLWLLAHQFSGVHLSDKIAGELPLPC